LDPIFFRSMPISFVTPTPKRMLEQAICENIVHIQNQHPFCHVMSDQAPLLLRTFYPLFRLSKPLTITWYLLERFARVKMTDKKSLSFLKSFKKPFLAIFPTPDHLLFDSVPILNHSYLVGKLTSSKITATKVPNEICVVQY
jgi:hypothetical protein